MRRNRYNFDALQDQHLDAMIRLAYKQADALEAQRIADGYCRASCGAAFSGGGRRGLRVV